jgi:hypothetical protein
LFLQNIYQDIILILGVFVSNVTGQRGELNVAESLMRDLNGRPRFSVKFLGEKSPLFDYVVNLLDDKETEIGAYFMVQVKATKKADPEKSIPARFSAEEVEQSVNRKIPVYLMAVDQTGGRNREIFFLAIDAQRKKGVSSVARVHDLDCDVTLQMLYDEVVAYHDGKGHNFVSQFAGGQL